MRDEAKPPYEALRAAILRVERRRRMEVQP